MSVKKGEATIKDLSKQQASKVMELVRRLGQETKQKQKFKNLYEQLKIEHQQLKRKTTSILQSQKKQAEENRFLKLQLKSSLKKLQPLRSSFVSTRSNEEKEDDNPNIPKISYKTSDRDNRTNSKNNKKQILELKSSIQKMCKQLKYQIPSHSFIQRSVDKQCEQKQVSISTQKEQDSFLPDHKLKQYETIKSRYQSDTQSYISDQATKINAMQSKQLQPQYTTTRKVVQKQTRIQRQSFYTSDLLDLVEMLQ